MYKVLCDNALMCDSRIEELALINPVVKLEENKAGSFSFTIPPVHPSYDTIQKRKTIVEVYLDDEEEPVFSGMCIEAKVDFYKQKYIYCEGELSYLNDSIQRPAKHQVYTVRGLLETYIENHNAQVEESKQFQVGVVTVDNPSEHIICYTNMENTLKSIKKDLVDDLGGIIRIRHQDGIRYIDYLAESPGTNSQEIRLGENLVDFTSNIDSSGIATAVIPLGAKSEEIVVEGLETRLTIESVNDGCDYVHSAEAVANYGWIYKTISFDNIVEPGLLKAKGEKYLTETQFENVVIEAKAIDLHFADNDVVRMKLSNQSRVVSTPHGLNKYFRLTKQTLNLNNPESDTFTFGKSEKMPLSAKNTQAIYEFHKLAESIVPPSKILNQAVENATALITSAMGGYVVKTNEELLIMDTPDIETATRVWRWNINGLGYSSTGYAGPYALAMTMDGSIVADFIASGTMYADRIKGGTLTIGGADGSDGQCVVLDANGNEVARLDKNGLTSSSARITGGNINISSVIQGNVPIKFTGTDGRTIEIDPYSTRMKSNEGLYVELNVGGLASGTYFGGEYTPKASLTFDGAISSQYAYDNVVSDSPNVVVEGNGLFKRASSSSKRYKVDITDAISEELNPEKLYEMPVKMYKYKEGYLAKGDSKEGKDIIGFIVEDLEDVYKAAVQYKDGKPEMWNSNILIPAMLKLIQEQNERIKQIEERLGEFNG